MNAKLRAARRPKLQTKKPATSPVTARPKAAAPRSRRTPATRRTGSTFDVRQYGATGDGSTYDTVAIQKAIDACVAAGGGTVLIPPGTYLSGPLTLGSRVTFSVDAGAVLKASPRLKDYHVEDPKLRGRSMESERCGFITARGADTVTLTGRGMIDGSGMAFVDPARLHTGSDTDKQYTRQGDAFMDPKYGTQHGPLAHGERPGNMLRFFNCTNLTIEGVTICNSPTWTVQVRECVLVNIRGVHIHSNDSGRRVPNDDGIDLCESRHVHIADCHIETGDDCIAIFGGEGITVVNCTLLSRSAGIRVGYTSGDIRGCVFSNLFIDANRGIMMNVRGEGSVRDCLFSTIVFRTRLVTGHWWGKGEIVQISAMRLRQDGRPLGTISGIHFENISAEGDAGIIIHGCEESVISDVSFSNARVKLTNSPLQESYGGNFDLRGTADLSVGLFKHDIPAVFCRHARGVRLRTVTVTWDERVPAFFTHAIEARHFEDLLIDGFEGRQAQVGSQVPAIMLAKGRTVSVRNCAAAVGTGVFLKLEGVEDTRILGGNDLANAKTAVVGLAQAQE